MTACSTCPVFTGNIRLIDSLLRRWGCRVIFASQDVTLEFVSLIFQGWVRACMTLHTWVHLLHHQMSFPSSPVRAAGGDLSPKLVLRIGVLATSMGILLVIPRVMSNTNFAPGMENWSYSFCKSLPDLGVTSVHYD